MNMPVQQRMSAVRRARGRRGFTLLECALAMVILGVGVMALIEAQAAFFRANEYSSQAATGSYLANEIRERMRSMPKHDPVTGLYVSSGAAQGWGPETNELGIEDFDDCDDFDGAEFGPGARYPGPVDSVGRVIPQVTLDGTIETDNNGANVPMRGWRQRVVVDKVEPTDYSQVRSDEYERATGAVPLRADQFALRVTVVVTWQGPTDTAAREMARLTWIVP